MRILGMSWRESPAWARMIVASVAFAGVGGSGALSQSTVEQSPVLPIDVTDQELPESEDYTVRRGDSLQVIVLEDPELSRGALVRPDGRISLPIAGTIDAEGRTPEELQGEIRNRLRGNFIEPPNVTVSVSGVAPAAVVREEADLPHEFFVLGEVPRPGRYSYDEEQGVTILEALSLAGGPGPFAALSRIQIREIVDEQETIRLFDYSVIEDGLLTNPGDLTELENGAVIVVPERGLFE